MIHITHRYQEDRTRFSTPEEAIKSTTTNTGGALAGSAFTTVAGFGILMTASLVPFQQLGLVTAYTIAMALVVRRRAPEHARPVGPLAPQSR